MILVVLLFTWALHSVMAQSNALYALSKNKVYLKLTSNDLISVDFSIAGDIGINSESINLISTPNEEFDVFLVGDELYSIYGDKSGDLSLSKYNEQANKWDNLELNVTGLTDYKYYKSSSYLPTYGTDEVYIYGGIIDDQISNRLVSLNTETLLVSNITTTTKPEPFYGAASLYAPDVQTRLLIAGESSGGWLNMFQLATWNANSGWSFSKVGQEKVDIESRVNPMVFPIFNRLDNSSVQTIMSDYQVSQVLIIGGEGDQGDALPKTVYLDIANNDWSYSIPNTEEFKVDDYLGVFTAFSNIIGITESSKRDGQYDIYMFDLDFKPTSKLSIPNEKTSKEVKKEIQQKAILGTVIPICSLAIIIAAGFVVMKKRKEKKLQQELKDLNYHFENFYQTDKPQVFNDSHSTLDVNSIDSWVRKRQEYDRNIDDRKPFVSQETLQDPEFDELEEPQPLKTIDKLNKLVIRLKKSISFNNLPSPERRANLLNDDEAKIESTTSNKYQQLRSSPYIGVPQDSTPEFEEPEPVIEPRMYDDETNSFDYTLENLDVQVLVSSKRRSTLKVTNPDVSRQNSVQNNLRYRTPSNEVKEEN